MCGAKIHWHFDVTYLMNRMILWACGVPLDSSFYALSDYVIKNNILIIFNIFNSPEARSYQGDFLEITLQNLTQVPDVA